MIKNPDLQKEILENVTEGITPSALKKKLKKSKSADDITNISLTDNSNPEVKKQTDLNSLLTEQLKEKQTEIELLRKQKEDSAKQIELLRKNLSEISTELKETKQELDNCLEARYNSLQDWNKQQEIIKSLNQELNETIDQASEELVANDSEISKLRTKISQLKTVKEQLERDLKLARISQGTNPEKPLNSNAENLTICLFLTIVLVSLLTNSEKENLWSKKL